ncbi:hypothetical protein W02_06820 [Nitrospira sp. KM1]|uniref:AAA family ATPase n=1 Tax=Nitrospira sp. KM1 TaxID=1936990 RepID=UPI0013A77C25|nr:AAA family ATPase [Nitrospira sp. KM1]BCA53542.1 hypothetical protein W02_06820 [Nitrospira sp. KM1]
MYESFYNLRAKPFALLPDSDFLYPGSIHRAAYSLLEYGLLSQAPFIVLTGDPGMGKTSLLQKLIAEHGTKHSIGLVTNARYDIDHLLPWILLALKLTQKRLDPVEAYHMFSEFLLRESKQHRRVILVIDEAQSLGAELLEELRLLSNLNDGRTLKLQIILSGQPDLHTLLKRIDMTQFAQRIVADYHLEPLSETDTAQYIRHRLQIAGGHPTLLTDRACKLVHRLSRGNPRLINQVCDIALTYGFAEQARIITSKLVAQAAFDRTRGGILPLSAKEDLSGLANAPEDTTEVEASSIPCPPTRPSAQRFDSAPLRSVGSPERCYVQGMSLKNDGRLKEAIDMFELASKSASHWLKAHAQIGLCYKTMGEPQSAIQAFRNALNDQSASRKDVNDVQYFLGRTLESIGQNAEALSVYRRITQVTPAFKDVSFRIKELSVRPRDAQAGRLQPQTANGSWLKRLIGNPK